MNPEKKWKKYTQVGEIFVNMDGYRAKLTPAENNCVVWSGPRHVQGYGMIGYLTADGQRKMTVVHRVAMRMKLKRELNTGEDVLHICNNPLCCNPQHLYLRNNQETQARVKALSKTSLSE